MDAASFTVVNRVAEEETSPTTNSKHYSENKYDMKLNYSRNPVKLQ